jgi:ubiquitin carboxyl-terminal hydrolase 47
MMDEASQVPLPPPPPPPPPKFANAIKLTSQSNSTSLEEVLKRNTKFKQSQASNDNSSSLYEAISNWNFAEKSETGFAGLSNQGATCYLNSLLQTLFMTPEFRDCLFKWRFNPTSDGDPKWCIPYQLQKLFAFLQLGERPTYETSQLMKSFGWTQTDAFEQHDIQELMRVLFEAMDKIFTCGNFGTAASSSIHQLYEGLLKDYIQCQECHYTRIRKDIFMDISLVVRGVSSIEEALAFHSRPELLEGSNQWRCEGCQKKVNALKGLKFYRLPYFLTIQLKRFDFDFVTFRRIKLSNKVTFPLILDMNKFVDESEGITVHPEDICSVSFGELDKKSNSQSSFQKAVQDKNYVSEDQKVDLSKYEGKPNIYELFSVMVHSGGATGGHYFAFIKSFETGKWYKFNDAFVTEINQHDIYQMFGGDLPKRKEQTSESITQSDIGYSTNAYLLMYRLFDPKRNKNNFRVDIPEELIKEVALDNQRYLAAKREFIKQRDNLILHIYTQPLSCNPSLMIPTMVNIDKNETLATATKIVHETLGLNNTNSPYPLECVLLRNYNPETGTIGEYWELTPEQASKKLSELGFVSNKPLWLQTREKGNQFPPDTKEIVVKVVRVNESTNDFEPALPLKVPSDGTLIELKRITEKALRIPANEILVVRATPDGFTTVLNKSDAILGKDLGIKDGTVLHIERCLDPACSIIVRKFEEERNKITICYNLLGSREYDQTIVIDKRKTLLDFKEEIKDKIGLPIDEFVLCRNLLGKAYKDERKTLEEIGMYDGSQFFIQKGKPLRLTQIKVNFLYLLPQSDSQMQQFDNEYSFSLVLDENISIKDLKQMILTRSYPNAKNITDISFVRLREKKGSRGGKILFNEKTLKESITHLKDGLELIIQFLSVPDALQPDDMIFELEQWFPASQKLSERQEIVLKRDATIATLKSTISQRYHIPIQHVCVAKPYLYQLKKELHLLGSFLNWYVDNDCQLTKSPWYLQDGDLLLFKDDREPEIENNYDSLADGSPKLAPSLNRPQEKALKIWTIYDPEYQQELQRREAEDKQKRQTEEATN